MHFAAVILWLGCFQPAASSESQRLRASADSGDSLQESEEEEELEGMRLGGGGMPALWLRLQESLGCAPSSPAARDSGPPLFDSVPEPDSLLADSAVGLDSELDPDSASGLESGLGGDSAPAGDSEGPVDMDADGHFSPETGGDDCDDTDASTYPGAAEREGPECMRDADGDGFGDASPDSPEVIPGQDCDDSDPHTQPGAAELEEDSGACMQDQDEDGWGSQEPTHPEVQAGEDCDDSDPETWPGAPEEGILTADRDCDGTASFGGSVEGADYIFLGENAEDQAGYSVSRAGDVDGDGLDDFLIGAYGSDDTAESSGKAYLILGSSLGSPGSELSLSAASQSFVGEGSGDMAGYSLSAVLDLSGDGRTEILISAPENENTYQNGGAVYLFQSDSLALSGTVSLGEADVQILSEGDTYYSGYSVEGVEDLDGDGLGDFITGTPNHNVKGRAQVWLGASIPSAGGTLSMGDADYMLDGHDTSDFTGCAVASAGDVDGDGVGDLLVGAKNATGDADSSGVAYLVYGSTLAGEPVIELSGADHTFLGETASSYAGGAVASAGDVDGDGRDDLLIGAWGYGGSLEGRAYLVLSSSLGSPGSAHSLSSADILFDGQGSYAQLGRSLLGTGDLDGDGLGEIAIGAPTDTVPAVTLAGRVFPLSGAQLHAKSTWVLDEEVSFYGEEGASYTGIDLSIVGDVNGDRRVDLLLGAYGHSSYTGAAYLFLNRL